MPFVLGFENTLRAFEFKFERLGLYLPAAISLLSSYNDLLLTLFLSSTRNVSIQLVVRDVTGDSD
jgi:hypothetical protein